MAQRGVEFLGDRGFCGAGIGGSCGTEQWSYESQTWV